MAKKTQGNVVNIQAPKLHVWQKEFMRMFDLNRSDCRDVREQPMTTYYIVKSPRQCGKSFTIEMLLGKQSVNYKNSVSWCICPTLHQARKIHREIIKLFKDVPVIQKTDNQLLEIYFINGSEIHFGSAEQGEALRGNTVSGKGVLVIDEAAYINDQVIGIVTPYCNVHKRPIVMMSTPLFKTGMFHKLFTDTKHTKSIRQLDVAQYDLTMFLTPEQKALYRETMPPQKFLSDIEGQFMDEYSTVFGDFSSVLSNDFDHNDKNYYWGIDWGTGANGDYTAVSILNSKKQQVALKYFNDKTPEATIETLKELHTNYPAKKILVEKNSIGKIFFDLLRSALPKASIQAFVTTNESKNKIINQLQVAIMRQKIQLLDDVMQKVQMAGYQTEATKIGKVTYNASKASIHDDIIIATALSLEAVSSINYVII